MQLYFRPFACSLASRIALIESGHDAEFHHVDGHLLSDGNDFHSVNSLGYVPALHIGEPEALTENTAVLQYIADLKPQAGLAPAFGNPDRYRLQEWLSFVGAEIHKAFLFPTFWYKDDASLAKPRARIAQTLSMPATHLTDREFLVGDSFTVADAHLTWALLLLRPAGIDIAQWPSLSAYLARMQARPTVRDAIVTEMAVRKTMAASPA